VSPKVFVSPVPVGSLLRVRLLDHFYISPFLIRSLTCPWPDEDCPQHYPPPRPDTQWLTGNSAPPAVGSPDLGNSRVNVSPQLRRPCAPFHCGPKGFSQGAFDPFLGGLNVHTPPFGAISVSNRMITSGFIAPSSPPHHISPPSLFTMNLAPIAYANPRLNRLYSCGPQA